MLLKVHGKVNINECLEKCGLSAAYTQWGQRLYKVNSGIKFLFLFMYLLEGSMDGTQFL